MTFIFSVALGMASYQWMIKMMNFSDSLATPIAWAIGIGAMIILDNLSYLYKMLGTGNGRKKIKALEEENKRLQEENESLTLELEESKKTHSKEIDFHKY